MVCDLYGGRGRGGSYHLTAHALYELLYNPELRGFFVRQTSTTIYSSMWQDLKDRMNEAVEAGFNLSHIEISDNQSGDNTARNTRTGATIKTASFQTSSGRNTAKLKSLAGASHLWVEELEEVNESDYLKLEESFRKEGVKIKIIRSFNPPPKEHWIWKDYDLIPQTEEQLIERIKRVAQKENAKEIVEANRINKGVAMDNNYLLAKPKGYKHLAIFGDYSINRKNLSQDAINKYEIRLEKDFDYYCRTYLGLITSGSERAVLKGATKITLDEFLNAEGNLLIGIDFGDIAPNAIVLSKIDEDNKKWYALELNYLGDRELPILQAMAKINLPKHIPIIPDIAGRTQINLLRQNGYKVVAVNKSHDANVSAIKALRQYDLYLCGENLWSEYLNWKYSENKTGEMLEDEVPMKGNDHLMDAIKYSVIGKRFAINNFELKKYLSLTPNG